MEEVKRREMEAESEVDLRPLQCPTCKKVYSKKTEAKFINHLKTCGKGQYQCDICEKNYFSLMSLKKHLKCHLIGAVFRCLTCGKDFKTKFKLGLHSKIHKDKAERENERFQCEYCNKTFAWQSSLSRHLQSHFNTDQDAYTCKCGEGFTKYSKFYLHKKDCSLGKMDIKLTEEIAVSVGLSLHRCQLCNQGFKDRDKLDAHVVSCDPFSISSDSKVGILMSEDEKAGIEKVLTEKMAKFMDATPKTKRNASAFESQNTVDSQEPVRGMIDDIEVKKEDDESVVTTKTEVISDTPHEINIKTEKDHDTDTEIGKSTPLTENKRLKSTTTGAKQANLGKQLHARRDTLSKNQTVKRSKRNYEPKENMNRSRKMMESETGGIQSSAVASPVKIEKTDTAILSPSSMTPSRRTGRIRKQKQFPGYDVELPYLYHRKDLDVQQRNMSNIGEDMEVETLSLEAIEQKDIHQIKPNRHFTLNLEPTDIVEDSKAERIADCTESEETEGQMSGGNKSTDTELHVNHVPQTSPVKEEDSGNVRNLFAEKENDTVTENLKMNLKRKIRRKKSTGKKYRERGTRDSIRVPNNFLLTPHTEGGKTFITYECLTKSCSKVFHSIQKLGSHKKLAHKALFKYLCTGCGKEFGSFTVYRSHIRIEHSDTESLIFQLRDVKITIKDENKVVGKEILVCTKCGYRYGDLQESNHECVPMELEYYCPCCSYHSKLRDEITEHITSK